eukprot:350420-Chlamydomonas_euryale.AAC.6
MSSMPVDVPPLKSGWCSETDSGVFTTPTRVTSHLLTPALIANATTPTQVTSHLLTPAHTATATTPTRGHVTPAHTYSHCKRHHTHPGSRHTCSHLLTPALIANATGCVASQVTCNRHAGFATRGG